MKRILLTALFTLFLLFFPATTEAGRGCCSWHGGQAYCDSSVGRWVCNDGTYSPSCTCWKENPKPIPTPIIIPDNIKARWDFQYENGAYTVNFDWDDIPNNTGYSIAISKYAGGDPGPNTDTSDSKWSFKKVSTGKWYVNLKAGINHTWSRVSYWTIDVPVKPTPTPKPTNTPIPTQTPTPLPTNTPTPTIELTPTLEPEVKGESTSNNPTSTPLVKDSKTRNIDPFTGLVLLGGIVGGIYFIIRKFNTRKESIKNENT